MSVSISPAGLLSIIGDVQANGIDSVRLEGDKATVDPDPTTDVGAGPGVAVQFSGTAPAITSLQVDMKDGADTIRIDATSDFVLSGSARFDFGEGDSTLSLVTTGKILVGSLDVKTGDGTDSVVIQAGAGLGKVAGNASFDFKVGPSATSLTETDVLGPGGLRIRVAPKGGSATLTLTKADVARTVDLKTGSGLSAGLDATGGTLGGIKVNGSLAIATLTDAIVNGNVSLSSPDFASTLRLSGSTVTGGTTLKGAIQNELSTTGGASQVGSVTLSMAPGAIVRVQGTSLTVNGDFSAAAKLQALVSFTPTSSSEFKGKTTLRGGSLANTITVNSNARFSKDLSVTAPDGRSVIDIGDSNAVLSVLGNLNIRGGTGLDYVTLNRVDVTGNTTIDTGAGTDRVTIDGSTFTGTFSTDLGAGDDGLSIARDGTATSGVTFTGKATIKTGAGNDFLSLGIGGNANAQAVFAGAGSKIDGGTGFNTFDDGATMNYTGLTFGTSTVNFTDPVP